jgi:hypothetical protein
MAIVTKTKKMPTHVKKRSGLHHRKSKVYSKSYWPYLPMLIIVCLGLIVNSLLSQGGHVLGDSSNLTPTTLLSSTNSARESDNESDLTLNQELMEAAQNKANNMAQLNYWSHNTPSGKTPWTFITAAGYDYAAAGENLAYGFSSGSATVAGWMNSPVHRANILDTNYTNVGFGIASSPNYQNQGPEVIIVAMYAEPVQTAANITFTVNNPTSTNPSLKNSQPASQLISRFEVLTGNSSEWALLTVAGLVGASLATFVIRHGLKLHRYLRKSKKFVSHHPYFDTLAVAIVVIGLLLTHSSGVIR